jgi:integrase
MAEGAICGEDAKMAKALTAKRIAKLRKIPGRYADGETAGLYLQVTTPPTIQRPRGAASWILRYQVGDKEHMLGIGSLSEFTLKEARDRAKLARQQLKDGVDPIDARKAAKAAAALEAARSKTFKECASEHYRSMESGWRSAAHAKEYWRSLENHALPMLGALAVSAIDTGAIMRTLRPIWETIPETAARVRQRIEAVLDWATVMGYRAGDNPARWGGHLAHLLPARSEISIKHHAALPYAELPAFMTKLRQREGVAERALEFAITVAGRTGEILGARHREVDLRAGVWTIPGERMKGGQQHRVPLSPAAVALLKAVPGDKSPDSFVFQRPGGQPLVRGALQWALAGLRSGITVHGFRAAFKTWADEQTSYPPHIVEMALAHAVGDQVEQAYRRSDLFARRRKLMEQWSAFCSKPVRAKAVPAGEVVVPIGAARS